ncbi:DNA recombination protein RmuC [Candidatus Termititenax dinenymphae]|uniref:DNA recombination protein RmuC n=1 Tax=Candidatus Termititenax dinenymphae TaxID=2218523 RepID=A0A388TKM9_9BACT|nr:DNA recombination protein RmuC [Candidatus Termititenax dinenymphae]
MEGFMEIILISLLILILIIILVLTFKIFARSANPVIDLEKNLLKELNESKLFMVKETGENFTKVTQSLLDNSRNISKDFDGLKDSVQARVNELVKTVDAKLSEISSKVEEKLNKGFEKTNTAFASMMERLGKIDEAQKKIELLSQDVGSLQDVLTDKKNRGTYGEVHLNQILKSIFGENNTRMYTLQQPIGNEGCKVDAMLYCPEPLGKIPVDSKFPMENYNRMFDKTLDELTREKARKDFKQNIKKHIDDIASKYIIKGETTQAIMFLPAEAIFAEINAYHPDLIEYTQPKNVWIASPTTFMALLTTVQSVIKNIDTQKQASIIKTHLDKLAEEFGRYTKRWGSLSKHIEEVSNDVKDISTTTDKISKQFTSIEKVDFESLPEPE